MQDRKRGYETTESVGAYIDERKHFGWELRGQRVVEFGGIKEGDHVLDLCCGAGMVAKTVREVVGSKGRIVGIDISKDFVQYARRFCNFENCSFVVGDVERLDEYLEGEKFDIAHLLASWFWIKDQSNLCRLVRKHLKPEGRFIPSISSDNLEDDTTRNFYWIYRANLKKQVRKLSPDKDLSYFDKLPVVDRKFVDGVIKQVESCGFKLLNENEGGRDLDYDGKLYTYKTPARTGWVGDFSPSVQYEIIKNALEETKKMTGEGIIIKKHTFYLTFGI